MLFDEPDERGAAEERLPPELDRLVEELFGLEERLGAALGVEEREGEELGRDRDSKLPLDWRVRAVVSFERGGVETESRERGFAERVEAPRSELERSEPQESKSPRSLVPTERSLGFEELRVAGARVAGPSPFGPVERNAASSVARRVRCLSAS